jgi:hypothetical protein
MFFHQYSGKDSLIFCGRPPRFLKIFMLIPDALSGHRPIRSAAGDLWRLQRNDLNSTTQHPAPSSAASCKRRNKRSSVPSDQANTAAQAPERNACSIVHKTSVPC